MTEISLKRPLLMLQADTREAESAARRAVEHGLGAVLVAPSDQRGHRYDVLEAAADRFAQIAGFVPELDANNYAGKNRLDGDYTISSAWAHQQTRIGVVEITTDSGFVQAGRLDQVEGVLQQASDLQQVLGRSVVATLALDSTLLRDHGDEVLERVQSQGVQVAIALGHRGDPLGAQKTVRGFIALARTGLVRLRRSDLSAIGALAFGATSAAIGTRSGLRHVYPAAGGGAIASEFPSLIIERMLAWRTYDRIADAATTYPREDIWVCGCSNCEGRSIEYSVRHDNPEQVMRHNLSVSSGIAERVTSSSDPVATWFAMCSAAQSYTYEVGSEVGISWEPQDYLGAWIANQPSRVGA